MAVANKARVTTATDFILDMVLKCIMWGIRCTYLPPRRLAMGLQALRIPDVRFLKANLSKIHFNTQGGKVFKVCANIKRIHNILQNPNLSDIPHLA